MTKTLADFRPQHDNDCASLFCLCGEMGSPSESGDGHGEQACTCGLDALLAALSSPSHDWQPIASAPKDGTQLLLWITGIEPRPRIGYWADRGSDSGWYGLQTQHFIGVNVTHWMPLPAPPKET